MSATKHEWLVRFVEHRVADRRVVRLIQKWLRAGVLENGVRVTSEVGTVQGGSISPLLANLYLHYVLDLWVQRWRGRARGDVIVVRFADDFVMGFEHQDEAERFLIELRERFAQFDLELHPDKTRLIEFGQLAARNRKRRGEGKPSTFDFLGFTHACGQTLARRLKILRHTARKRLQAKLAAVAATLRKRLHWPVPKLGAWLASVVRGHVGYFGVPDNGQAIHSFRFQVGAHWTRAMRRRSQVDRTTWARMTRLIARWASRSVSACAAACGLPRLRVAGKRERAEFPRRVSIPRPTVERFTSLGVDADPGTTTPEIIR